MQKLSIKLNREDDFVDITEPIELVYPEAEVIDGVVYEHIANGVYKPQEEIILGDVEFRKLYARYCDLVFFAIRQKNEEEYFFKIYYVHSYIGCGSGRSCLVTWLGKDEDLPRELQTWSGSDNGFYKVVDPDTENIETCTGLCKAKAVTEVKSYQGYKNYVNINGCIGYLIEPGIYYFGKPSWSYASGRCTECNGLFYLGLSSLDENMAAIMYASEDGGSFAMIDSVEYLAIGEASINRLRQIHKGMERAYFRVFDKVDKNKKTIVDFDEFVQTLSEIEKDTNKEECEIASAIPEDALEIVEGMGFKKLKLGYKYVFRKSKKISEYDIAFLQGNKLVLINDSVNGVKRIECDLRLLEEVIVEKEEKLNCGKSIKRFIKVIDCREDKEREVLTKEAYELMKNIANEGDD